MVPFIHKLLLSGERVLIHCYAGCHRSVCLVLGYIMCYTQFSLQESIDVLQNKWNRVGLNFLQSLVNYSLLIKRVR
jgi:protein-tyrosine phosphatase